MSSSSPSFGKTDALIDSWNAGAVLKFKHHIDQDPYTQIFNTASEQENAFTPHILACQLHLLPDILSKKAKERVLILREVSFVSSQVMKSENLSIALLLQTNVIASRFRELVEERIWTSTRPSSDEVDGNLSDEEQ